MVFEARSPFVTERLCKPVAWADERCLSIYIVSSLLLACPDLGLVDSCRSSVTESRKFSGIWIIGGVAARVIEQDLGNIIVREQRESVGKPVHQITLCRDILGGERRSFVGVIL